MLLIYLPEFTARCEYVFDLIFKYESGIEYRATTDITELENYSEEKINYSSGRIANEFFIRSSSLLFEKEIKRHCDQSTVCLMKFLFQSI